MFGYILRRIVLVLWICTTTLFISSFFIPDYHYDHYDNVQVLSHKVDKKRHDRCVDSSHDHYYLTYHYVKFSATDRNGNRHTFENQYNDSNYKEIITSKTYSTFNCCRSVFTWLGFLIFTVILFPTYIFEEDDDYTNSEIKEILPIRITAWYCWQTFLGKDNTLLERVADKELEYVDRNNYFNSIPKYSYYTEKYNNLVKEQKNSTKK